jgi:hypothetical protein
MLCAEASISVSMRLSRWALFTGLAFAEPSSAAAQARVRVMGSYTAHR